MQAEQETPGSSRADPEEAPPVECHILCAHQADRTRRTSSCLNGQFRMAYACAQPKEPTTCDR
jgi:hypothetical protein